MREAGKLFLLSQCIWTQCDWETHHTWYEKLYFAKMAEHYLPFQMALLYHSEVGLYSLLWIWVAVTLEILPCDFQGQVIKSNTTSAWHSGDPHDLKHSYHSTHKEPHGGTTCSHCDWQPSQALVGNHHLPPGMWVKTPASGLWVMLAEATNSVQVVWNRASHLYCALPELLTFRICEHNKMIVLRLDSE